MEHYNLLYVPEKQKGLWVMKTEVYCSRLQHRPGWAHENRGDFNSRIPCKDLALRIHQSLEAAVDVGKIEINPKVYAAESIRDHCGEYTHEYLIIYRGGVRLYIPRFHREDNASARYLSLSSFFIESLFAETQEERTLPSLVQKAKSAEAATREISIPGVHSARESVRAFARLFPSIYTIKKFDN